MTSYILRKDSIHLIRVITNILLTASQGATRSEILRYVNLDEQESEIFLSFLLENELLEFDQKAEQVATRTDDQATAYKTSEKGTKLLEGYCQLQKADHHFAPM